MLGEALKISSPLALISKEVPRFHGGSLWHSTPGFTLTKYIIGKIFWKDKLVIHNAINRTVLAKIEKYRAVIF